jgi:hypothetical protein
MDNPQYSFSRLDLYDRCPWAFKTVYRDKIPRAQSEALQTGTVMHQLVADYLGRLIASAQLTDWEWARAAIPKEPVAQVSEMVEMWERFYQTFTLPPVMDAPGVENKLAFDSDWQPCAFFSEEAYFRMVIDFHFRQEALGVIVDWKTNRAVPETVQKDLQLRTYGWGLKQALYPEIEEVLLRLHFLRYGKEREVLLSSQDLAAVPDELQARIEVIEADQNFTPTPGSFCGWCGVTAHCPVIAKALVPVEVMAPVTREQAGKAASLLLTLQNLEKELAARLKDWVRETGPIQVGDMVYGPSQVVSYDLDPQTITMILLESGLTRDEIWPFLSLNKTNLERGLRKLRRKDLYELAISTGSQKITERVDFRNARE